MVLQQVCLFSVQVQQVFCLFSVQLLLLFQELFLVFDKVCPLFFVDCRVKKVSRAVDLDAIKLVMGNSVLFATGSYRLSADAEAMLSRVAYNLKQYPNTDITVVGYTDNTGSQQVNDKLSLERAQAVMNYLEGQGVAQSRLKAVGKGWNDPIASNSTAAGRAQNRRVEIFITADKQMIENARKQAN